MSEIQVLNECILTVVQAPRITKLAKTLPFGRQVQE